MEVRFNTVSNASKHKNCTVSSQQKTSEALLSCGTDPEINCFVVYS